MKSLVIGALILKSDREVVYSKLDLIDLIQLQFSEFAPPNDDRTEPEFDRKFLF